MASGGRASRVQAPEARRRRVSRLVRALLSALIVAHFAAILTAVTSAGTRDFPPPPLAIEANRWVMPYLKFVHLTNAYRFFARNPGPTDLIWFRIRFESGRVRWLEWPSPDSRWLGIEQQRELAMAMTLRAHLTTSSSARWPRLNPAGEACVSSFARYLARTQARADRHGNAVGDSVASVQIYLVSHRMLMPYEVQMGWRHTDLRLYQPIVPLGTYDGRGRSVVPSSDVAEGPAAPPSVFARWVIQEDVHTAAAGGGGEFAVPHPIRDFLARFPSFKAPTASGEVLRAEIERVILGEDTPERIRDAARRTFELQLRTPKGGPGRGADRGGA